MVDRISWSSVFIKYFDPTFRPGRYVQMILKDRLDSLTDTYAVVSVAPMESASEFQVLNCARSDIRSNSRLTVLGVLVQDEAQLVFRRAVPDSHCAGRGQVSCGATCGRDHICRRWPPCVHWSIEGSDETGRRVMDGDAVQAPRQSSPSAVSSAMWGMPACPGLWIRSKQVH